MKVLCSLADKSVKPVFVLITFLFSFSNCGWAGLNQHNEKNKKNQLNTILGMVSYSLTSNGNSSISAPKVLSILPDTNSTNIPINTSVVVTFSQSMDSNTLNNTNIRILDGSTAISTTVTPISTSKVLIQPTLTLGNSKTYIVNISKEVTDSNSKALESTYSSYFTTAADTQSFNVASISPSNTSINVPINSGIFVTFSRAVDTSTLTTTNITLTASGNSTSNVITISPIGTSSVLILPSTSMTHSRLHVFQLTSGIKDTLGNSLSVTPYTSIFTTFNSDPDSGSVTTLAGTGSSGNVDGTGTAASFNSPQHLIMNIAEDTLYVTDTGNHRIRTVGAANGVVTNVAGLSSGYTAATGTAARFNSPKGIFRTAVSGVELFFISDSGNNGIRKMTAARVVSNTFGTNTNAAGFVISTSTSAQRYRNPEGFAVDFVSGYQYTVDTGNHCIRRSTNASTGVSNTSPNTSCFAGATQAGGFGTSGFVNGSLTTARFNTPKGIAIDSVGNIFISDYGNHSIRMITPGGAVSTIAGSGSSGYANGSGTTATFNNPSDIAIDGDGILYVADGGNCAIRKLILDITKTSADVTTYAGATPDITVSKCGYINGTRLVSRFSNPTGLWLASNNKLYVTDTGNHAIRVIEY